MWWNRIEPSDVLVVCTGNVCRSPYVAHRLQHALPGLTVTSAGTGALVGRPPTLPVLSLLLDCGISAAEASAQSLTRGLVRGARLVITAERRHRVEVVRLVPDAANRAFTLRELARLLQRLGPPDEPGVEGVLAVAREALAGGEDIDHDDDLADPYGRSDADFDQMAATAEAALAVVVPALRTTVSR